MFRSHREGFDSMIRHLAFNAMAARRYGNFEQDLKWPLQERWEVTT